MKVVELEGVSKRYRKTTALADVDLVVNQGEVVGLAGINGVGKTTLVNLLMGFISADTGSLSIVGEDPLKRRHLGKVGWMPERPSFPSRLRVSQVLDLQAATFAEWDDPLVDELLNTLELRSNDKIHSLSRGQLARVALVCALGHRPSVLLLDDPTLGLDPAARRLLLGELLASVAEAGAGVLLATHLLGEAELALDRLLILKDHTIACDAPVEDYKNNYRRIEIPADAPSPPAELGLVSSREGMLTSAWSETAWQQYCREIPEAQASRVDLETIFIALTGGGR